MMVFFKMRTSILQLVLPIQLPEYEVSLNGETEQMISSYLSKVGIEPVPPVTVE